MRPPVPLRRAWFEVKTLVAQHPALAIPIAGRRHGVPFGPNTELVIEGFPRTGTTFAVSAFHRAQPRRVEVACNVHAPAQVLAAVRKRVPALVVIREPQPTLVSFVIRHSHISVRQALRGYVRFYVPLLRSRGDLVVASFDDLTTDFGEVIARVNEKFGTAFALFDHTEENVRAVFDEIEGDYLGRLSGDGFERAVARPSAVRTQLGDEARTAYLAPAVASLRRRAEDLYRAFVPARSAGDASPR